MVTSVVAFVASVAASKMHDFGVQQRQHGLIHARVSGRVPAF